MKLHSLNTGYFKLDGGAMFGVVPKSLWSRTNPADERNMCRWAMRSLLIEQGDRLILVDTGIGDKQSEKFFSYYYLHGEDGLEKNLTALGFSIPAITDVFLTHLHFDHVGGAVKRNANGLLVPTFPNAHYWSNERHWNWAVQPNAREKASFLKENILPLQESGQLKFIEVDEGELQVRTQLGFDVLLVHGHTESQMLPLIENNGKQILFTADLLPSAGHIPLPYFLGYDTRPLFTLDEKKRILNEAADKDILLFFEHDPDNECARLEPSDKGPVLSSVHALKDVFE